MDERERKEIEVFNAALERSTGAERDGYLEQACRDEPALRQKVEALLRVQADAEAYFHEVKDTGTGQAPAGAEDQTGTVLAPLTEGPGTVIGRYKILEKIGEGGFGVVYVAEQREPVKRRVALKIIKLGMDTRQVVARFEAERQALALMDHPNIAKVLDAGATESGRPYFVMELFKGIPITTYSNQEKLGTRERLDLFIQVCHAIQHAHQKGIIHRDIKPSNILVTLHDGVPVPKVIDFGIAKATQQELTEKTVYTQFQQFIGTPAYMSPEQAEMSGLDIDTRSDIYSLGVLLYELLTGSTPFDTKELLKSGLDEMRKIIRERQPVRPSTRLTQQFRLDADPKIANRKSQIANDLDWIVMKCLEKDRTRRYETANGVALDIERHLKHEPVVARPPSVGYRLQKSFRRNRLAFTAAGVVTLALVLGAFVSTWQAVQATNERERADQAAWLAKTQQERATQGEQKAKASELAARRQAYASDMNLAQQALTANNLGRARELLYRQRPAANESDLRGWEWRYLWQFCQSDALFKLCQKTNDILSLSVSADGRWLAIGETWHGGLSIWDLRTRKETTRLPAGDGRVRTAFSPRQPLLAFCSETGLWGTTNYQCAVHLWDAISGREEAQHSLDGLYQGLAFSADGQTLVTSTAGAEGRVSLWRVPSLQTIASYPAPQDVRLMGSRCAFAVTPDLSLAAVGSDYLRVLDLSTGKECWSVPADNYSGGVPYWSVAFSPDGRVLVGAQGIVSPTMHFWDVVSGREIGPANRDHLVWISQTLFAGDGHTLVTACADQTIRVWDASNLANLLPRGRPFRAHRQEVWSLAMLPDQRTLVSGCKDGSVLLWDIGAPRNAHAFVTLQIRRGIEKGGWSFTTDSKSVVGQDNEFHVARWQGEDFQDKKLLFDVSSIPDAPPSVHFGPCFSDDGRFFALGSTNGVVRVWDLEGRGFPREFTAKATWVWPIKFVPHRHSLVVVHYADHSVHLLDLATWKETGSWDASALTDMTAVAVSPDERWCVLFGWEDLSWLIEMATGHSRNLGLDLRQVSSPAFSPDGKLLAAGSHTGVVCLWETATWRKVRSLGGILLGCVSVAFSPDGSRMAMGSNGQEAVKLRDTAMYQDLLTLPGSGSLFSPTAFSPDGNVLGSMNESGLLHLWRAPSWAEIEAAEKSTEWETQ